MLLLATLIFFTRLPFWRIKDVPAEDFKRVVPRWPIVGWLTGLMMALVLWLCSHVMPLTLAWILAIVTRLLLTGCLHEDGLADFIDGFGGGTTRERTLAIMKDSHIGTYGVIGLIVYFALLLQLPATLSRDTLILAVLCGDCWSKCCAAQLINFLPYARTEETAKNKTVYARMKLGELILCFFFAAGVVDAAQNPGLHRRLLRRDFPALRAEFLSFGIDLLLYRGLTLTLPPWKSFSFATRHPMSRSEPATGRPTFP